MAEYNVLEVVDIETPEEPEHGDDFIDLAVIKRVEGNDSMRFVQKRQGYFQSVDLENGGSDLVRRFNKNKCVSLGKPEYLLDIHEAMSELIKRLGMKGDISGFWNEGDDENGSGEESS